MNAEEPARERDAPEPPAEPGAARPARPRGGGVVAAVRETVLVVAVALVISLVVKTFLLQAFYIPSQSMERTLDIGDRVVVSKLTPGPFTLHRGDVVVFADPGGWLAETPEPERSPLGAVVADVLTFVGLLPEDSDEHLIKRVVGLPGDHVVCCDAQGRTTVNGEPVDESGYLFPDAEPSRDPFDVVVPEGRLWVMGDNRAESADSRYNRGAQYEGFVPLDHVVGRAHAVVWPLDHLDWLGTPDAFDDVPGRSGVG
ncbi:signal peptidase I [Paenibacillus sp. TRM 82003]|uniref:signal peptidase I n=1 Tax=Kineococcus sp. TRM81007 TaxID=2925831 RepID=UPI001F58A006|nr:signal peptidase I [Kineococcus sp. TRM81007]MCI2240230.1 signal peptidase I [Kineococcus sp. TRM81007]MCI3927592.1 signal peptidase I [Paenibacillus sp. TRM 82003]